MQDHATTPVPPFDLFAEEYLQHAEHSPFNALYDRPAVLEMLGDVEGLKVLDAGCGPGLYAEELLEAGAEVTGLDSSSEMVRLAKERLGERADIRVHDLEKPLDWLENDTFDAVVMALVIHHLDERMPALEEIYRVLRPGGRLVLSTHHPMADFLRFGGSYFTTEPITETWQGTWQVHYWRMPLTAMCEEFYSSGFWIERLVEPMPQPEMAAQFPEQFLELTRQPAFVLFELRKLGDDDVVVES